MKSEGTLLCHKILLLQNKFSPLHPILFKIHFNIILVVTPKYLKHFDMEMKPGNAYKHFKVYNII